MFKNILKKVIFAGLFAVPFVPFLVYGEFFFPFITTKAFAFRFIVEVIFACWAALAISYPEYRPKRSPILYAIGAFLLIIGTADLFGVEPVKSFWSNFERMEGYISLLHFGALFLVIGSFFDEHDWRRWWKTNLFASFLMVVYCAFQLMGAFPINQGGVRVDGTLGNATYLAVYMLVNIFIAFYLWRRSKSSSRFYYLILIVLELWILYHTATRGAILGFLGGAGIVALLNLRSEEKLMRQSSRFLIGGLVVIVLGFFALRDTGLVKNSPVLSRFASISTEELKSGGRAFVWPMAIDGIKERPILGWGQDNFNYVFNEHYNPKMYNLEPWFDRAHNIFLDWGIAGGFLGLLSYLSLYGVSLWLLRRSDFSREEKSILIGLMAAYFFHNFFVFDQLISYIFFFSFLAYIHAHSIAREERKVERKAPYSLNIVMIPVLAVFLAVFYFVEVQPLRANVALINVLQNIGGDDQAKVRAADYLEKAYRLSRLGRPETVEQISQQTVPILASGLPLERKNSFYHFAKEAVVAQTVEYPDDARYEILAAMFLAQTSSLDEAESHFRKALTLMPGKQLIYFEYGNVLLSKGDRAGALAAFKYAYDLAPQYEEAKIVYLVGAIYAGDRSLEERLVNEIGEHAVVFDDRIAGAYYANKRMSELRAIIERRIALDPANAALYADYLKQLK